MKLIFFILFLHCSYLSYSQSPSIKYTDKFRIDTLFLSKNNSNTFLQSYKFPFFCKLEHEHGLKFKIMPCFRLGTLEASNAIEYSSEKYYKK